MDLLSLPTPQATKVLQCSHLQLTGNSNSPMLPQGKEKKNYTLLEPGSKVPLLLSD